MWMVVSTAKISGSAAKKQDDDGLLYYILNQAGWQQSSYDKCKDCT